MKKLLLFSIFLLLAAISSSAFAGYRGDISFSEEDKQRHVDGLQTIMGKAAECLQADLQYHWKFYDKWKISPFYGDRSNFAKNVSERRNYLRSYRRFSEEQISYYLKIMKPTSCVGLVLKCLGAGFAAAGQDDIWQKLRAFTMQNDVSGGALQQGLQSLGWRLAYWNPDTGRSEIWDQYERMRKPENPQNIWGYHAYHWGQVQRNRKYLYNRVDDISSLVNFGEQIPPAIVSIPFFVGVAHAGYHVFPGSYGQIIEGHSMRSLSDRQTIETSPFNPLAKNGGPRGSYFSGLIAIPPGYLETPVSNRFVQGQGRKDSNFYPSDDNYQPSRDRRRQSNPSWMEDLFGF